MRKGIGMDNGSRRGGRRGGSFATGGGRGRWNGGGRWMRGAGGRGAARGGWKRFPEDGKRVNYSFGTDEKSAYGRNGKKKNMLKKAYSEPSTPSTGKVIKYEGEAEQEDMSLSDMEDEETTAKISLKKMRLERKGMEMHSSQNGVKALVLKGLQKKNAVRHGDMDEEKVSALLTGQKVKKDGLINAESSEDEEEQSDDEDEEEDENESEEDDEGFGTTKKSGSGDIEMTGSDDEEDEDESDEEESLEDEDEEEAPSEVKTSFAATPGKTVPLKSALKTPGTGKSINKKVSLFAATTATPETLKNKTPVTPHPIKGIDKSITPTTRRLKFEESDDSDEDEEEEDDDEEGSEDEMKLIASEKKKMMGDGGSEDEDEDGDEEMTDEDEEESDEDEEENNDILDTKVRVMKMRQEGTIQDLSINKDKGTKKKVALQKQTNVSADKEEPKGIKRKFEVGPVLKPEDAKDVINEEQKRREERDKKSLFVRGLPKDVKLGQLKALHDDILFVRHIPHRNFAWLFFANEQLCEKAYEDISKQTVEGRTLTVDFCGAKSKTRPQKDRSQLPINPLELFVGGLPPSASKDQMKVIFRQATNISFPKQARTKNKLYCFVQFGTEKEARAAFEKGKTLKINGAPVDVLYARIRKGITDEAKPKKVNADPNVSGAVALRSEAKKLAKKASVNEDTTSEEIESSEEGIEEEESSASKPKKAKLLEAENCEVMPKTVSLKRKRIEVVKSAALLKKAVKPKLNGSSAKTFLGPGGNSRDGGSDEDEDEEGYDDVDDDGDSDGSGDGGGDNDSDDDVEDERDEEEDDNEGMEDSGDSS